MKKTYAKIVAIIAMVVIMLAGNSALAYTGDGFSIDMPSTYTSGGSNSWVSTSSKATVNVQVLDNTAGETISQESLQESVESLKSAYSGIVIEKSEITKLNGMDALHIASNVSSMYLDQYVVVTSSKVFVLTMGAYEKSYLSSSEATSILGSFKVDGASSSNTGYTGNGNNTINNTINNSVNNTVNNTANNTTNTDNKVTNTDDDDEKENTTKKKSSKSDDEDEDENKTWVIVAIIAGVIVFALLAIIIIVAIVVSGKKKQQF